MDYLNSFIATKTLFDLHAELNQIYGALSAIASMRTPEKSVEEMFPDFCKLLNEVNQKMQEFRQ